jgi:small-conductance mechanosensitive channel
LFERPIRINDFVDVANFSGVVTAIGTRCSKLRRGDGVEILIPNSTILQSTLVNWTLTDSDARFELLVGINYGSKVENAVQIILDITNAHPDILTKYPPEVYFHDFGNDAIVLRLFYWVDRSRLGIVNRVPSELRMSIYNAFNAAGIGLAFPQRDVHLQTTQPISVEILSAKNT